MNPTSKKFISLFLVFSLMMLSANLYAKERRGAKLIITKKDGQQIRGELITVKPNSLLLLDTEGKDVSVDIADIKVIKIKRKSKALLGAGIGFLACIVAAKIGIINQIYFVGIFIITGIITGGMWGGYIGRDKTIQIEGKSDSEIQETLDKLRKKARIPDYN
jgi:hypothetical protein